MLALGLNGIFACRDYLTANLPVAPQFILYSLYSSFKATFPQGTCTQGNIQPAQYSWVPRFVAERFSSQLQKAFPSCQNHTRRPGLKLRTAAGRGKERRQEMQCGPPKWLHASQAPFGRGDAGSQPSPDHRLLHCKTDRNLHGTHCVQWCASWDWLSDLSKCALTGCGHCLAILKQQGGIWDRAKRNQSNLGLQHSVPTSLSRQSSSMLDSFEPLPKRSCQPPHPPQDVKCKIQRTEI